MATVNVSITLKTQAVPANQTASASVLYQLFKDGAAIDQGVVGLPTVTATFTNVADGTFTVTAQRLSNLNQPIGDSAVSQPFTVVNTMNIDVPDVVSIAL